MDEKHPQEGSEGPREVWGGGQSPQERGDPGGSSPPRGVWGDGSPQERGDPGGSSPRDNTAPPTGDVRVDPGGSSPRDNTAPPTGDVRVDDAIAALSRLDGRPPDEQVAILEEVHGRLRDILGELAERPEVSEGHEQQ